MVVISNKAIRLFGEKYKNGKEAVGNWYYIMQ